jgi:hypothetical protein
MVRILDFFLQADFLCQAELDAKFFEEFLTFVHLYNTSESKRDVFGVLVTKHVRPLYIL